ncbi:RagB/SusD family nutrient uptake outer membrane protein [Cesiribacter sp. SM1]|uniref:RagB/SusD family nutrient uptake outer membrane protein n=1 Tax=Cesiribacter sp. SM1 TaxID=2861196 RepID=UPI001CD23C77|nr:RagB/SusD family nutrient uptake outer membrane protein [Cesiribacter sp. SM1]
MKKIFQYILIATGVVFAGCEEDLDTINPNQPTIEVFWQNAQDAQQGVNAIYSTSHRGGFSRWMPMIYISRSDIGYSASPWADLANALDRFIQPDYNFGPVADIWVDNYVGIFRANQVIANVPDIEMDNTLKQRLLGEAHFLRGLFYYHLVTLWGNVPLMLDPSTPTDLPETASKEQVWAQIVEDLTFAANALPASYSEPGNIGRATKGAANALLAKAYMQQQNYQAALAPLQWLVEGEGAGIYGLVPDYRDNFLITTENNMESVFEWQFAENPTEVTDNDVQTPDHNYGTSIAQFMAPRGIGWSDMQARRWPIYEFLEEETVNGERDPRLEATYLFDSTDVRGPEFTMVYGQTFAERYPDDEGEVWFRKFLNDHWKDEEGYRSPNNWRFIRYSDVLLMYAEVLNATGNTEQAYQYVDRVRERVNLAPLSEVMPNLNQEEFLEQLKHERLLELAGEGHRWNDLMRWGDLGPELADRDPGFANFEPGKHELLPIPQRDLDINPNLEQNPRW